MFKMFIYLLVLIFFQILYIGDKIGSDKEMTSDTLAKKGAADQTLKYVRLVNFKET